MPRLVPEKPIFPADRGTEKAVWKALRDSLPEDVTLLHGVRIDNNQADREGDLIVIWPGLGIAFIEVKGGHVTPQSDGTFRQQGRFGHSKIINPVEQSHNMIYQVRHWVLGHTSMSNWFPSAPMVAFPFANLPDDYVNPQADRCLFITQRDMNQIAEKVKFALLERAGRNVALSHQDADRIVEALQSTSYDARDPRHLALFLDARTQLVEAMIESNLRMLEFVSELNRFQVQGPAGSGKTAMAIAQAHRLTSEGKKVLFICYSALLAEVLRHNEESISTRSERIAAIETLHALAKRWGVQIPERPTQEFWEIQAPSQLIEHARKQPLEEKFDAVVVDEAQDFAPLWWSAVQALLKDGESGGIFAFGDTGQGIFGRAGNNDIELVPLRLSTNLRNTQQIAAQANKLTDFPGPCLGPDGPEIYYIEVPEDASAIYAGDDAVADMLEYYRPQDIALLTTKHRHEEQKRLQEANRRNYHRQFWEGSDIFYSTVMSFKGLERHCIVLVVDGFHDDVDARELLYVGMTRASDFLVVVGHRHNLEGNIDPEVMAKLDANVWKLDEYHSDSRAETDD